MFFWKRYHDELIDFGAFAHTHHGVPTVLSPSKEREERGKETATVQRVSPWGIRRRVSPESKESNGKNAALRYTHFLIEDIRIARTYSNMKFFVLEEFLDETGKSAA